MKLQAFNKLSATKVGKLFSFCKIERLSSPFPVFTRIVFIPAFFPHCTSATVSPIKYDFSRSTLNSLAASNKSFARGFLHTDSSQRTVIQDEQDNNKMHLFLFYIPREDY